MISLRWYQEEAVQSIYDYFGNGKAGNPIVVLPTGCHAKGHGILMFDGSVKPVEDVAIGDLVMGPDSKSRTVLDLRRGRQEMRRIIPKRGVDSFVVNADHILHLQVTAKSKDLNPTLENVSVADFEKGSIGFKTERRLKRVAIEFPEKDLVIDPYVLGLLLGDGSMTRSAVTYTTADKELMGLVSGHMLSEYNLVSKLYQKENCKAATAFFTKGFYSKSSNKLIDRLRDIGLMGCRSWEKFVPRQYLTSSSEQRRALLAGLCDSDGWMDDGESVTISTSSEKLAIDIVFLAKSLGLSTSKCNPVKNGYRDKHGMFVKCRDAYKISIRGNIGMLPFKRNAHKDSLKCRVTKKSSLVNGFDIEKLPEDDFYGFLLSDDHLYVDWQFVVHHNSGKSLVIAEFVRRAMSQWPQTRVLMLVAQKELIEQNFAKIKELWPGAPVGIYSASIGKKQTNFPITFAGIQSIGKKADLLGHIDLVIADECQLISQNENTLYRKLFSDLWKNNPNMKIIGLTATPFRLGVGHLTDGGIFTDICYDLTTMDAFARLMAEGYLSRMVSRPMKTTLDVTGVHIRGGDFVESELQSAIDKESITTAAVAEIIQLGADRKHWLIFCSGVDHAHHVADCLNANGIPTGVVHGGLTKGERERIIADYKSGKLRAVAHVNVLAVGFDFPGIDLIAWLRPTQSPVLWAQGNGRGLRPFPGKENTLVLDFSANTRRLGPINDIVPPRKKGQRTGEAPVKECPNCTFYVHASLQTCSECGFLFPPPQSKLQQYASTENIMKGDLPKIEVFKVDHVTYRIHRKGPDNPPTLKVSYFCGLRMFDEWVCLEHTTNIVNKARHWWAGRCNADACMEIPTTIADALTKVDYLQAPTHLKIWTNKKFPEVMAYDFSGTGFGEYNG